MQRAAILRDCDELERLTAEIIKAAKESLARPGDKQAFAKLESLVENAKLVNQRLIVSIYIFIETIDIYISPSPLSLFISHINTPTYR